MMPKPKVYVALSTFARQSLQPLTLLKDSGCILTFNASGTRVTGQQLIQEAHDADGIIAGVEHYDAGVLDALVRLKCISRCGVGIDNIDLAYARQKSITVLNTPEAVIQPVAELTVAMIFDLLRGLTLQTQLMRQKKWEKITGLQISGKKVGIVGLGRIGRKVAELLTKFGMIVYAYDVAPQRDWAEALGISFLSLEELLANSDVVTLHVASSLQQPFYLGKAQLSLMKQGSFLVNVARGNLIDEKALVEVLSNGHLAGAALDVYSQEPYNGPLCELPNVILTPHTATLTQEARPAMETQAVLNLLNFLNPDRIKK